jgi:hypothetical protein
LKRYLPGIRTAAGASLWYLAATCVMTWPLLSGIGRDIPWDLGDSVLNCWIMQWDADRILRILGGNVGAIKGFWNANIFYPEPLALAYSEHLVAETIQILPVYALSGNIVLSFNVLFMSSFVLSGLGAYLLVRELTGSPRAAFVAGLLYGFAPYRIGQFSHVQVLCSQWMPMALYGFRRYFDTGRRRALAGAAAALIAQNLSCGYFVFYFSPFVAAYVIYEIADRGRWTDHRLWAEMTAAAVAVTAFTLPFLLPYQELRAHGGQSRPFGEVLAFSPDVYSYLTAHGAVRVWGEILRAFPKPEGDLFPSFTPVLLALVGLCLHASTVWQSTQTDLAGTTTKSTSPAGAESSVGAARTLVARAFAGADGLLARVIPNARTRETLRHAASVVAFGMLVVYAALTGVILATSGFVTSLGPLSLRVQNMARTFRSAIYAGVVLLLLSERARRFVRGIPRSALLFYVIAAMMAFWLSLGPITMSHGIRVAGDGPYGWLYWHVPGFDGLRVPARMAMIVALFLSVVAGYGCVEIERRWRRGGLVVLLAGLLFLVESTAAPIELNGVWQPGDLKKPEPRLLTGDRVPAVYSFVRTLPADAVLAEFPFGDEQYDMRYMLYSATHWRPLVNGYSGGFPASFIANKAALGRVLQAPDKAWTQLGQTGATHAIVHEGVYLSQDGATVSAWLTGHGARLMETFDTDRVFELPRK